MGSYRGKIYPSFALMVITRYLGADLRDIRVSGNSIQIKDRKGRRWKIPITPQGDMWLNYYGKLGWLKDFPDHPWYGTVWKDNLKERELNDDRVNCKSKTSS